jgi:hypothetical protein
MHGSLKERTKAADVISKIEGALQELEETCRVELLGESNIVAPERLNPPHDEARELIAILVTIARKAQEKQHSK